MATPYSEIYDLFKDLIVKDTTFYVTGVTEAEIAELAEIRMKKLLNRAITNIITIKDKKNFEVDFYNKDDVTETFLFDLIEVEKHFIADYMFYCYAGEDRIVMWKALKQRNFTDNDIKIIMNSPANSLKEFNNSVNELKAENESKVKVYLRRDRETWKYKSTNFNIEL
jgi:hypothetical protein